MASPTVDVEEWKAFRSFALERHEELDSLAGRRDEDAIRRLYNIAHPLGQCLLIWALDDRPRIVLDQVRLLCERAWSLYNGHGDPGRSAVLGADKPYQETFAPAKVRRDWNRMQKWVAPMVFRRDGYVCLHCGSQDRLTVDHVLAIQRGGQNWLENLQTLCHSCNSRKGAR